MARGSVLEESWKGETAQYDDPKASYADSIWADVALAQGEVDPNYYEGDWADDGAGDIYQSYQSVQSQSIEEFMRNPSTAIQNLDSFVMRQ